MGEEKDKGANRIGKIFSRSISLIECSPKKSSSKPQWNSKARACLPPLQPLSITRPTSDEWPRPGFDDLGIWLNPPTPGARLGSITPRENSSVDQPPIEFEFRKDKLAFFEKECSKILDHVYLGSNAVAKNRTILRQNGITHVLNCVGFVCPEYFKNDLVYMTLWLQDCPSEDISSILYDVFDYFEDVRQQGGRVFVHCCQGVSRSASLVIAYLIWKKEQSFEDAFQHVKAVRGVTNPNVGFACQLLQIQKRVHALPTSPASVLRMYRMAPHSPYDPLHVVPKLLCESGPDRLDSRGGFIIHIPSTIYVWIGKHCPSIMSSNAMAAASQAVRYESAKAPVIIVKEGEEPFEFWAAICHGKSSADRCFVKSSEDRKLNEYDLDFEIFHRALAGGVVPPFSEAGTETSVPSREDDWHKLRKKFASDLVKESILNFGALQVHKELDVINITKEVLEDSADTCIEDFVSTGDLSTPSSSHCDSPDSFSSCVTNSPVWIEKTEFPDPLYDNSLSRSPSFSLLDSFTSCLVSKSYSSSTSPSLSPSTSDSSSSFTLSPSSSNLSDTSFVSAQTVAYAFETRDTYPSMGGSVEEIVGPKDENARWLHNVDSRQTDEAFSSNDTSRTRDLCSASEENFTILTSIDEASQVSENSARPLSSFAEDDAMSDAESSSLHREAYFEMVEEYPISDAISYVAEDKVLVELLVDKRVILGAPFWGVKEQAWSPPRGWNSYDSFCWTVSEEEFLQNARLVAQRLRAHGYEYVVVDYLWYRRKVNGAGVDSLGFDVIDEWGRMIPDPDRWPSSRGGKGFSEVAKIVHGMGLKFGIHVMRGMSTQAFSANTPILDITTGKAYEENGREWMAKDVGIKERACAWMQHGFMSVNTKLGAGRAFLRSLYQQYADWGVDFVKHDCVFGDDLDLDEISYVSKVLSEVNHPVLYSLSPGTSVTPAMAKSVSGLVNMYRITGDDWDTWGDVASHFDISRDFSAANMIGAEGLHGKSWPDLDMLPLGWLTDPGTNEGPHRKCNLNIDEQKTQMTLWSMAKSPLMFGGDMRQLDDATFKIITNPTLLEINSFSSNNKEFPYVTCQNGFEVKDRSLSETLTLDLTSCHDSKARGWSSRATGFDLEQVCWEGNFSRRENEPLCLYKKQPLLLPDEDRRYKHHYHGKVHLLETGRLGSCLSASPNQKLTSKESKRGSFSTCRWDANQMWQLNANGTLANSYSSSCASVNTAKVNSATNGVRAWTALGRNGEIYVAFFNLNPSNVVMSMKISDLGKLFPGENVGNGYGLCKCREEWSGKDFGVVKELLSIEVVTHGCALFVLNC